MCVTKASFPYPFPGGERSGNKVGFPSVRRNAHKKTPCSSLYLPLPSEGRNKGGKGTTEGMPILVSEATKGLLVTHTKCVGLSLPYSPVGVDFVYIQNLPHSLLVGISLPGRRPIR